MSHSRKIVLSCLCLPLVAFLAIIWSNQAEARAFDHNNSERVWTSVTDSLDAVQFMDNEAGNPVAQVADRDRRDDSRDGRYDRDDRRDDRDGRYDRDDRRDRRHDYNSNSNSKSKSKHRKDSYTKKPPKQRKDRDRNRRSDNRRNDNNRRDDNRRDDDRDRRDHR
ncbi:MAG: hypothetical protein LBP22_13050 [Deltaproteobacteria bacterium]|nr:hypothetical protein [Deltaproteobacteria bacterium]